MSVRPAGAPAATPHDFVPGTRLGRYLLLEPIGQGGMGAVYLAYDPSLKRRVALKVLRGDDDEDASASGARLLRESQALARVAHPNVVSVHEVGQIDGEYFISMDYVEGQTLYEWIASERRSWRTVLAKFKAAARGLAAVHAAGLVHRDFKPANVLVAHDGRVCVMDFGLARSRKEAASSDDSITGPGELIGTPEYMSPEHFQRRSPDAQSDQFSYCVALYEALYGERPFAGTSTIEIASSVSRGKIKTPSRRRRVPAWLHGVVTRGLRTKPDERFPSMNHLLEAIERDERRDILIAPSLARVLGGAVWMALVLVGDRIGDPAGAKQVPGLCLYILFAVAIVAGQRLNATMREYAYVAIPIIDVPFVWWERHVAVLAYLGAQGPSGAWGAVVLTASLFMVLIALSVTTTEPLLVITTTLLAVPLQVELSRIVHPDSILGPMYQVAPMLVLGSIGTFGATRVQALLRVTSRRD